MSARPSATIHATLVAWQGRGLLLVGPPGSGKSSLAWALIDQGWMLVADDQVLLGRSADQLWGSAPARLRGLIEQRGLGVRACSWRRRAPVIAALELGAAARWPEPGRMALLDCAVPALPFDPAAPDAAGRAARTFQALCRTLGRAHAEPSFPQS